MKPHFIFLAAVIAVISLFSLACKKDSSPSSKTKTELITSGTWKFNKATASGINVTGFLEDCQKDNTITFSSNGNGVADEGATRCDSNDPQTISFTWNFAGNESVVHVSTQLFTGGSGDFNLEGLSETELMLSQNADFSGTSQKVVFTFVH
jgi:hypothetical protein